MKTIGERIKKVMQDKGINQVQLASKSGIRQGRLTNIINDHTKEPYGTTLAKIATALEIDLYWLIGGDELYDRVSTVRESYAKYKEDN